MKKLIIGLLLIVPLLVTAAGPYTITGVVHTTQITIACGMKYASSNSITGWLPAELRDLTIATDPRQANQTLYVGFQTNSIYDIHTETTNSVSWVVTNTFTPVLFPMVDGALSISLSQGSPLKRIFLKGGATNTCYSIMGKGSY